MARLVFRVASVVAVGVVASACSSVPSWVDPTSWLSDKAPPAAEGGTTPELADISGKPPTTTPDDQKQVANSLAADRAQASYSAEQLRAEADQPSAPPPPAAPPQQKSDDTDSSQEKTKAAQADDSAPPQPEKKGNAMFEAAQGHGMAEVPQAAPSSATDTTAAPAPSLQVAAANPPPATTQPDTLGFQASSAPPLDPSVGQFVQPTAVNRYQTSASIGASSPAVGAASTASNPALVVFSGEGTKLTAGARAKVRELADAFQSQGGAGFVRVVGHYTSRTPNMSAEQHQQLVFQRSQDRANAVARELIKDGVPAAKVLVEAVGDSQPADNEAMPRGAEIFLQS